MVKPDCSPSESPERFVLLSVMCKTSGKVRNKRAELIYSWFPLARYVSCVRQFSQRTAESTCFFHACTATRTVLSNSLMVLIVVCFSHVDQVLRGFLERNVSRRLGAKKTTMFDIGGATAVKHHPFFEGIDWAKLIALQVEPPLKPDLASTTDTSNFAEEFVGMALPRSLSHESLLSHAESIEPPKVAEVEGMFRGFSFVADSFIEERDWERSQDVFRFVQGGGDGPSAGGVGVDGAPPKKVKGKRTRKKGKAKGIQASETTQQGAAPTTDSPIVEQGQAPITDAPRVKQEPEGGSNSVSGTVPNVFVREPIEELQSKPSTLAAMLKAQQKHTTLSTSNTAPSKPRPNVWGVSTLPAPAPVPTPSVHGGRTAPVRRLPGHRSAEGSGTFAWKRPV